MSIACVVCHKLSRGRGESARVHKGYLLGEECRHPLTGVSHNFSHLGPAFHNELLLPEGARADFADADLLWEATESRDVERRCDAQLATLYELALPSEEEATDWDRLTVAREFALRRVAEGLAVQLVIHAPSEEALEAQAVGGKRANWHAHLMATTRRLGVQARELGPEGFDRYKARDLDPEVRRIGGRGVVTEAEHLGNEWRAIQNAHFAAQGYGTRVDLNGLVHEIHVGPVRTWPAKPHQLERLEGLRAANREATYDIGAVLEALTEYDATFTGEELTRFLTKQLGKDAEDEVSYLRELVLKDPELRVLDDPETPSGRFSTWTVYAEEQAVLTAAQAIAARPSAGVDAGSIEEAKAASAQAGRELLEEQKAALDYACGPGDLKLITGRAGTGKSTTLSAVRAAHEATGKRVIGLAPANVVVQDMKREGFAEAYTVHSALTRLRNGMLDFGPDTVWIVDEAAMISTPVLKELVAIGAWDDGGDTGRKEGGRLILVGDDRQLPSIERGGMFSELLKRYAQNKDPAKHPVTLVQVLRQEEDWQKQASRDLAEYDFGKAVDAFERHGAIHFKDTDEAAQNALVAAWELDYRVWQKAHALDPTLPPETRGVAAYTNAEVDRLNQKLRKAYARLGNLTGPDVWLDVCYHMPEPGEPEELHRVAFAEGDLIQFTKTEKHADIFNGSLARITHIDAETGQMRAWVEAAAGRGWEVHWNTHQFNGIRHGFATSIHKKQGSSLDRVYVSHSKYLSRAPGYVALTRQIKSVQIFVTDESAKTSRPLALETLKQQLGRTEINNASIAWATQGGAANASFEVQPDAATSKRDAPGIATGKAGFLDAMKAHREKQALELLERWNRAITAYRSALSERNRHPSVYAQARTTLLAFADSLEQQTPIQPIDPTANPAETHALLDILEHPHPAQAIHTLITTAELGAQEETYAANSNTENSKALSTSQTRDRNRGRD